MIKFIEIYENSAGYDENIGKCRTTFSLRELFLNPNYIISMKESTRLNEKSKLETLVEGLDDKAIFTELVIASPGHTSKCYSVVGDPTSFLKNGVLK